MLHPAPSRRSKRAPKVLSLAMVVSAILTAQVPAHAAPTPAPSTPAPSAPAPTEPAPSEPTPSEPTPSEPAPSEPAPTTSPSPSTTPPSGRNQQREAAPEASLTPIEQRYQQSGGSSGPLGAQTVAEADFNGGRIAKYQYGQILWSASTGARILEADVAAVYDARLRFPTNEIVCGLVDQGCRQNFQGGVVLRHRTAGTFPVLAEIGAQYLALGGQNHSLRYPLDRQQCGIKDGGCYQRFQGGTFYWSPSTGAHPVLATFLTTFKSLDYERSRLGLPRTDQVCGLVDGGCYQHFQGGSIYWKSGLGAIPLWGAIRERWAGLQWERGRLGYPINKEECGFRDGGCLQRFEHGLMYWSKATGAHPVLGGILNAYATQRWERGPLGYPLGAESCSSASSCQQRFQFGLITWTSTEKGKISYWLVPTIRATTAADVQYTYRSGCPVGPSGLRTITMNYWGYDGLIHTGVMIVKASLAAEVVAAFSSAYSARLPIYQMKNPNVWKGDDPAQMAANNTSGFNCRHVVGNPYSMSKHSYGIAIDINPVQNPFRDRNGTWWPGNGTSYIMGAVLNRNSSDPAVLKTNSSITLALEARGWFWGGRWSPGRDYQHFERR